MDTYKDLAVNPRKRSQILTRLFLCNLPVLFSYVVWLIDESLKHPTIGSLLVLALIQMGLVLQDGAEFSETMGRKKLSQLIQSAINTGGFLVIATAFFQIWWREGLNR